VSETGRALNSPAPDVVVIGGGLVGWSAAYRLVRAGVRVTVVDRAGPGYATNAGAGIIAPGTSFRPLPAFYPFGSAAVAYYPRLIEELAEDGETETGYEVVGCLFIAKNEDEATQLPETLRIMTERRDGGMGNIGDLSLVDSATAQSLFPPLAPIAAAIYLTGAARVNGGPFRDALRRAAEKRGATTVVGTGSPVLNGNRVTGVQVDDFIIPTDAVIISGGTWSNDLGDQLGVRLPVEPQRGQIIHLDLPGTETSAWPIVQGYFDHYLLTFRPNRVVMGATREIGSGYDVKMTAGGVHQVLSQGLSLAPALATATIAEIRIGLRPMSPDGLPIIGRAPGLANVYLCTGHGPSGLQLGPISGAAVASMVREIAPEIDLSPFSPDRFAGS
jgi:D-amino-acid dehydrogenase